MKWVLRLVFALIWAGSSTADSLDVKVDSLDLKNEELHFLGGRDHEALVTSSSMAYRPIERRTLSMQRPMLNERFHQYRERMETSSGGRVVTATRPTVGAHRVSNLYFGERTKETERMMSEADLRTELHVSRRHVPTDRLWWHRVNRFFNDWPVLRGLYRDGFHFGSTHMKLGSYSSYTATLQPVYGIEVIDTDDERESITRVTSGFRVEGAYGRSPKHGLLYFLVDFRDHAEYGNGPYVLRSQLYEDRWPAVALKDGNSTSYDVSESMLQYWTDYIAITAGRGRHQWGPADYGGLFLNGYAPPFDYLRADAAFESAVTEYGVYYTFLHGWPESPL